MKIVFEAELWLWDARRADTWVFVSLPASESEEIRDLSGGLRRGFGSLRVRATIGTSSWTTSIFPDSGAGYVLPVKRPVRAAQGLDVGDVAMVTVELVDFTEGSSSAGAGGENGVPPGQHHRLSPRGSSGNPARHSTACRPS